MKSIYQTSQFKKDFKKVRSRGKDLEKLKSLVMAISTGDPLESRHHDHPLSGKWTGSRLELLPPGLWGFVIGGVLNLVFLLVTLVLTLLSRNPDQEGPKTWRTTAARSSIWVACFTLCFQVCAWACEVLLTGLQ